MQRSKLVFSGAELQLACNQQVILTKNRIIDKVYERFGELGRSLFDKFSPLQQAFPPEMAVLPKISKGEQYNGFPWVMLDYPRWFNQQKGHLALRVMFLWGNYFLVQVQVSGNYLPGVFKSIHKAFLNGQFAENEVYSGFPEDPYDFNIPQPGMVKPWEQNWETPFGESRIFKIIEVLPLQTGQLADRTLANAQIVMDGLASF